MQGFIGRRRQLELLDQALRSARAGEGGFVWMRGRRRIGKSRLIEEFLRQAGAAHVFFQAPRGAGRDGLADFVEAAATSTLASAPTFAGVRPNNWRAALELAATGATPDNPAIIVIDEYPYLHEADDGIDADVQHGWDRSLERLPVLLICVGSDLSMMDRLLEPDRPLHGRPTLQLTLPGLTPAEIAELTGLEPADALDAYLVVGGFPALARQWKAGASRIAFLTGQLADSSGALVVNGERIVHAEFPTDANARTVLHAIGAGERTYTNIQRDSGLAKSTFDRSLATLLAKQVVERVTPVSVPLRKDAHYVVADAHLRFWLRFVGPHVAELERGRSDLALARIERDWSTFRGRSIEPVIRDGLSRLLATEHFGEANDVGSFWTRRGDVEVDLVGVDSLERARRIGFVGSIKWRERAPFNRADTAALAAARATVPGAGPDALLLAVSRSGFDTTGLDVQLGPSDVIDAFRYSSGQGRPG